jgi:hypothetical protein
MKSWVHFLAVVKSVEGTAKIYSQKRFSPPYGLKKYKIQGYILQNMFFNPTNKILLHFAVQLSYNLQLSLSMFFCLNK